MIALTAAEIAAATGGVLRPDTLDPRTVVTGPVVVDSRQVGPGSLFVALPGEHVDGHDFAAGAVAAGAALVVAARELTGPAGEALPCVVVPDVEKALGDLARDVLVRLREAAVEPGGSGLQVVAVTGSVGKTTTKDLLAQLCGAAGPTVAPEKSFNNEIGLPLTVLRADEQTRYLVLEMGASGIGHLTYLTDIAPPDVAVVLVVGSAHLGEFGGIEAVARAKSELVAGLVPGGTAVLNAQDERVMAMAALASGDVVTFGGTPAATVRATDIRLDRAGRVSFTLVAPGADGTDASAPVQLRLVGEHHLNNALAAAAASLAVGLPLEHVAQVLSAADALSPHRMHVVDRPDGVTVVDDSYNANPDSMRAALKALAVLAGRDRRSVAVLGEMLELGPDARAEHEAIGLMVVRLNVALTVVVGAGAQAIADGAMREGSWGDEVVVVPDVDAAERFLAEELRAGDVVLVKSSYGSGLWQLGDRLLAPQEVAP
ncbi:UDP-N-acetylmuramoyl-tripeptide--D-alanyl-D-alanine ligase [Cellulomonas cellasea]|uniref:UDP-N-acetylmuramoyl-tripeptide--D-alanyl-D-alanine ligase n=2 Tax=Cellulomonas cellasea TaxID=43670 RepID=A0A0A0B1W9_9CELL|nr:UDP-N-acetylmuramoyl-tripeptide--D-alanyl-D-alanine ligase [Cellulomonas cellasea]KGM00800.1 UDP-N-acetylmuramoyl-tripeptide--D-alanyl-D-alanine ligase [Cellulomonas cellasea DSM 20118]GEA88254.1 UDP-N-acetylmuramoyl-tripeptide--D-alanyl-D-alanine ligase [Cellulomonas cellasea]